MHKRTTHRVYKHGSGAFASATCMVPPPLPVVWRALAFPPPPAVLVRLGENRADQWPGHIRKQSCSIPESCHFWNTHLTNSANHAKAPIKVTVKVWGVHTGNEKAVPQCQPHHWCFLGVSLSFASAGLPLPAIRVQILDNKAHTLGRSTRFASQ